MGQITRSVLAQQAVFFLSPLAVGAAHSVVALKVVIDLVKTFGGLTISGMVGVTCAIFLAAYGGYFLVTSAASSGRRFGRARASRHAARNEALQISAAQGGRPQGRPLFSRFRLRWPRLSLTLEIVHLVRGEPERHGKSLALGGVDGDLHAHLGREAPHEP